MSAQTSPTGREGGNVEEDKEDRQDLLPKNSTDTMICDVTRVCVCEYNDLVPSLCLGVCVYLVRGGSAEVFDSKGVK